jgi:hypothetical protein
MQTNSDVVSAEYRIFSENDTDEIHHAFGKDISNPQITGRSSVSSGETIKFYLPPNLNGNRILFSAGVSGFPEVHYEEFFIPAPILYIQSIYPTPLAGEVEWIRICSTGGLAPGDVAAGLYIRDSSSTDKIVPYLQRFSQMPAGYSLSGNSLTLQTNSCAILVDPDFNSTGSQIIPLLNEDTSLWTIETSSAIGNGLSSGEGFLIFRMENDLSTSPLCSFGKPDTSSPYSVPSANGERIERVKGTIKDSRKNFILKK